MCWICLIAYLVGVVAALPLAYLFFVWLIDLTKDW